MRLDVYHHIIFEADPHEMDLLRKILRAQEQTNTKLEALHMNQTELAEKLGAVADQLRKAQAEIIAAIAAAGAVSPEVEAKVNALGEVAQALDDLNPDA